MCNVFLFNFWLDEIANVESGILNFPNIIIFLYISHFSCVNICFIYLGVSMLDA